VETHSFTSQEQISAEAVAMGTGRHKVLLLGYDLEFLEKRAAGLRQAGFEVDSVSSLERALALAQPNRYQLAIVGHAVREQDRNRLVRALKLPGSKVAVIFLYYDSIHNAAIADVVLSLAAGVEGLVAAANDLVGGTYSASCSVIPRESELHAKALAAARAPASQWGVTSFPRTSPRPQA
jgi:hypothetical protein